MNNTNRIYKNACYILLISILIFTSCKTTPPIENKISNSSIKDNNYKDIQNVAEQNNLNNSLPDTLMNNSVNTVESDTQLTENEIIEDITTEDIITEDTTNIAITEETTIPENITIIENTTTKDTEKKQEDKKTPNEIQKKAKKQEPAKKEAVNKSEKKETVNKNNKGEKLSSFTTKFNPGNLSRSANIKLAANKLNGTKVNPGEMFSFNSTIGPTGKENGYKLAKIVVNGKESTGYGGGVCQVSSTLFNACDFAGMKIVERKSHTKEVAYVGKNRDAATSYGGVDFKFKNIKDYPITIVSSVTRGAVSVSLDKAA